MSIDKKQLRVLAVYTTCCETTVKLPPGKTTDDVERWYVKWNTLFVKFRGEKDFAELDDLDESGEQDFKHPIRCDAYSVDDSALSDNVILENEAMS